jgi:26S proteasome non-ATPase regulatory subunit 9
MSKRAYALSLISQKEGLETDLLAQYDILKSHNSTMSTPLVDSEGFPRADIDIWAVRHARVRVIELRNDITTIVERIKVALEEAAAEDASAAPATNGIREANVTTNGVNGVYESRPFGKVNGVAPGSPGSTAVRFDVVSFVRSGTVILW